MNIRDPFFLKALREWRLEHAIEYLAILDFIYLPKRDQADILERARRLRKSEKSVEQLNQK